LFNNKLIFL